ncbi:protein-disulfide reductase DsbD domain-containing protein [Pseudotabrizicola sp. L79]|uniref:protein-disulfide reductase DsbD domain-containing protein n=1 Tax=Pseudotabrizicola sp. L79 TaxID=3118402 RepID=UPI002F95CAD5
MIKMFLLATAVATPALSQGLTQDDVVQGQFRAGWQTAPGAHISALHLELAQGWKTYWRAPGDAGIPPSFDWSGSSNLKSVRFHWPAPEVFHTAGMQTVGYHHRLVLPIEVEALDPAKPVTLRATVDLGVCKDICMPASLALSADLTIPGKADQVISAALQARPATAKEAGLRAIACAVEPIRDGLRVTARMTLPQQGRSEVVMIEPGQPGVWVSEAVVQRSGGDLVATVDMVPPSGQPFALTRSQVRITVIGQPGRAVDILGCPAG